MPLSPETKVAARSAGRKAQTIAPSTPGDKLAQTLSSIIGAIDKRFEGREQPPNPLSRPLELTEDVLNRGARVFLADVIPFMAGAVHGNPFLQPVLELQETPKLGPFGPGFITEQTGRLGSMQRTINRSIHGLSELGESVNPEAFGAGEVLGFGASPLGAISLSLPKIGTKVSEFVREFGGAAKHLSKFGTRETLKTTAKPGSNLAREKAQDTVAAEIRRTIADSKALQSNKFGEGLLGHLEGNIAEAYSRLGLALARKNPKRGQLQEINKEISKLEHRRDRVAGEVRRRALMQIQRDPKTRIGLDTLKEAGISTSSRKGFLELDPFQKPDIDELVGESITLRITEAYNKTKGRKLEKLLELHGKRPNEIPPGTFQELLEQAEPTPAEVAEFMFKARQ